MNIGEHFKYKITSKVGTVLTYTWAATGVAYWKNKGANVTQDIW
jgi:hypothetical protein